MLYRMNVILGDRDLDGSDKPFYWAQPVVQDPKDRDGKAITGPVGAALLYGVSRDMNLTVGKYYKLIVIGRGIEGLYNVVDPATVDELLLDMGIDSADKVPHAPLVASTASTGGNRAEKSKEARDRRRARATTTTTATAARGALSQGSSTSENLAGASEVAQPEVV